MSMFKKLKGIFILEDEDFKKEVKKSDSEEAPSVEEAIDVDVDYPVEEVSMPDMTTSSETTTKVDGKFVDILLKAIEKNNTGGFDYLEYKSSLQSLSNMNMDEETRYKSALAMAKTMGATPQKLISSANGYIEVLKKENTKFKQALKSQREKQVTGREGEINATMESIKKMKDQITALQKQIEVQEKKLETLKSGINKAAAKVQSTSDNFNHALNVVTAQIQTDIENMKNYLS